MFKFNLDPVKKYSLSKSSKIDLEFKYIQYAKKAFVEAISDKGSLVYPVGGHKPEGLWYAFGRGWVDWDKCSSESRGIDDSQLPPLFELEIDTSKFIKLTCANDILAFHTTYSVQDIISEYSDTTINWLKVSKQYDGIELSPYDPNCCDLYWYKTYDIASGCVWNLKTIKNIIRINKENK